MGLFGPSAEKIRRTAADAYPNVTWQMNIDWTSGGERLHKLNGTWSEDRDATETMQLARDAWKTVTGAYHLDPSDARHGLLDVSVSSGGCETQSTGVNG